MRKFIKLFILIPAIMLSLSCSNESKHNSVVPDIQSNPISSDTNTNSQAINHTLLGTWQLAFYTKNMKVSIEPDRDMMAHFNITSLIPQPVVEVLAWDPVTKIMDVNVTLYNLFNIGGYDLRLIVFTTNNGITFINPDDWTGLYDIPDGSKINPFKAYAKTNEKRKFSAMSGETEFFQFYIPSGSVNVTIAIDASYPGNCLEPYEIDLISQGKIYDFPGSSGDMLVKVLDWQDDVNNVWFYCPDITGQPLVAFTNVYPNYWKFNLVNNTSATTGQYTGVIIASSTNSGQTYLYDVVNIYITALTSCLPDNNETYDKASVIPYSYTITDCTDPDDSDWYVFYAPPNGVETATIKLNVATSDVSMVVYASEPGQSAPGTQIGSGINIPINNNTNSRYYMQISTYAGLRYYNLTVNVIPKLTTVDCILFVATDDGTANGKWPENESTGHILNTSDLNQMMAWANDIWNQYGYELHWDSTPTIISAQYYNLDAGEDSVMHDTYGKPTNKLSLYFVNSIYGTSTAYCRVVYPPTGQNVNLTFTVYSPNVWFWQSAVAHEHGHAFGYLFDEYLYDQAGCECGDNVCLGSTPFLFWCTDGCYEGNLMWYSLGLPWDQFDLVTGQSQWVSYFQFSYPNNFPWY